MIEFQAKDLCYSGGGRKIHIRYNYHMYCSPAEGETLNEEELISLTEKADILCRNCLREYKRVKGAF